MSFTASIEPDRTHADRAAPGAVGALSTEPPSASPDRLGSAPGWHVDPLDSRVLRFWDGQDWTKWTQPSQVPDPPAGWIRVVDPQWWEPPNDGTTDHLASWHLLAQHAQERRGVRKRRS